MSSSPILADEGMDLKISSSCETKKIILPLLDVRVTRTSKRLLSVQEANPHRTLPKVPVKTLYLKGGNNCQNTYWKYWNHLIYTEPTVECIYRKPHHPFHCQVLHWEINYRKINGDKSHASVVPLKNDNSYHSAYSQRQSQTAAPLWRNAVTSFPATVKIFMCARNKDTTRSFHKEHKRVTEESTMSKYGLATHLWGKNHRIK